MERILIIEDDLNILKLLRLFLENRGYEVKTAQNGIEGIEVLDGDPCFRVVLTDIRMPGKNGNHVAKYIRANEKMQDTRILAITAFPKDAEEALFDSVLTKPFEFKKLIALIDSFRLSVQQGR